MLRFSERTIYALSTPQGKAAIGIVRVSGPNSVQAVQSLAKGAGAWTSHRAVLTDLWGKSGFLDQVLLLYFAKNRSYTGEPLVELHCHGSPPVLSAVMQALSEAGCRHAEPGEFTKRAFYNGKIDLTKVEGIRDLLNAETELQRQLAVAGASGSLNSTYNEWRSQILHNKAMLAALIDFADDNEIEDTPNSLIQHVRANIASLHKDVHTHTRRIQQTELISEGFKLAVIGEPNAGKSSIVNRLVNRAASIVSDVPGTTRDIVHVNLDIGGYKVIIGDTAGIRSLDSLSGSGHDQLEQIGIERAREAVNNADILLVVLPLDRQISPIIAQELEQAKQRGVPTLILGNKTDIKTQELEVDLEISSRTGEGFDILLEKLAQTCAYASHTTSTSEMIGASKRTRELLSDQVLPGLEQALSMLENKDVIFASAELELAADGIAKITGRSIGVNEVLDVVFGSFCIGK